MPGDDMAQYLGVFLDEANEQIALLESDLLELETGSSQELLQRIFRAAHTLKGSSRAMGFSGMGELTHAMEDVLDRLRNGEMVVTQAVADALFEGVDQLKRLVGEVAATAAGGFPARYARNTSALRAGLILRRAQNTPPATLRVTPPQPSSSSEEGAMAAAWNDSTSPSGDYHCTILVLGSATL